MSAPDEVAPVVAQLRHLDAQAAAALQAVLVGGGALRVAALGHDEDVALVGDDGCVEQLVLATEVHPDHAGGASGPSAAAPRRSP